MVTARVFCSSSKRHTSFSFDPSTFFLGRVGHPVSVVDIKTRKAPPITRPKANAKILRTSLEDWRRNHEKFAASMVMGSSWILNDSGLKALAKADPDALGGPAEVAALLEETDEFATLHAPQILEVIDQHNREHPIKHSKKGGRGTQNGSGNKENDADLVFSDEYWSSDVPDTGEDERICAQLKGERRVAFRLRNINERTATTERQKALLAQKIAKKQANKVHN
jgi:hypothetical protein